MSISIHGTTQPWALRRIFEIGSKVLPQIRRYLQVRRLGRLFLLLKMTYAGCRGDDFLIYSDTILSEIRAVLAQFRKNVKFILAL